MVSLGYSYKTRLTQALCLLTNNLLTFIVLSYRDKISFSKQERADDDKSSKKQRHFSHNRNNMDKLEQFIDKYIDIIIIGNIIISAIAVILSIYNYVR